MQRTPFSQVLKSAKIDLRREYERLYGMFCLQKFANGSGGYVTLREICDARFMDLPFRGTCVSLDDFDDFYGYDFKKNPSDVDINYLVSFCEYSYNIVKERKELNSILSFLDFGEIMKLYIRQVLTVMESIGYMVNKQGGVSDFVPKDQVAISVAEIIDPSLSYRVIEYNHHSMRGDLERKKAILLALADKLEPERATLKSINATLESDLFCLFNNVKLRHNNADPTGQYYRPIVAAMNEEEVETWYDETYQMCLVAFLELEQNDRKNRVNQLKKELSNNGK